MDARNRDTHAMSIERAPGLSGADFVHEVRPHAAGPSPRILNEKRVADLLGVTIKTLRNWRSLSKGPIARRATSRLVVYLLDDVENWVRRLTPCGETMPLRRRGRPRQKG